MPHALASEMIVRFRDFVDNYEYRLLRSINCGTETEPLYRASPSAILAFLQGFRGQFHLSSDQGLRGYFAGIAYLGSNEALNVLALADALIAFRENIYSSDYKHNAEVRGQSPNTAKLFSHVKGSEQWVGWFHYTIEQQLELPELADYKFEYGKTIRGLQMLGRSCFEWIMKYRPDLVAHYKVLGSLRQQEAIALPNLLRVRCRLNFDRELTMKKRVSTDANTTRALTYFTQALFSLTTESEDLGKLKMSRRR